MSQSYKWLFYILIFLGIVIIGLVFIVVKPKAPILSGYVARMACTCHFVQKKSLNEIRSEDLSETHFKFNNIDIDQSQLSVTASTMGFYPKEAVYKPGLGCTLLKGENNFQFSFDRPEIIDTFKWQESDLLNDLQVSELNDHFFTPNGLNDNKMTKAALIIYKGKIIYESYDEGISSQTPLLGWSLTKSVIGTLIGQMISEGKLSLDQDHLFPEWNDERANIKLSDLLHMKSGLSWEEEYTKVSSATTMLFDIEDMVKFGKSLPLEDKVGEKFEYSSGTSNLLSGLLRSTAESHTEYLNYPYQYLFKPLGMKSAFIETDETGTMIGSSFMYASARDWAKYGMLYLNNGKWQDQQILDSTIVSNTFISDPVSNGAYGYHFWHNDIGIYPNAPKNLIYASGYQGQRIIIIPDQEIVIVRLGLRMIDFDKIISTTLNFIHQNIRSEN